jgi:hypothetical protein
MNKFSRFFIHCSICILCCFFAVNLSAQDQITTPEAAPASATVTVTVPFKGAVISGVTLICKGSETMLKVEGDYESFEWNTGSTERIIRVKEEGVYEVKVKTKGGCSFSSSVNVQVRPCS